jgi:N-acetylglucosamine-6-phosphate deacetylase
MARLLITQVRIVVPGVGIVAGDVLVKDARIAALGKLEVGSSPAGGEIRVNGGGRLLTPGLIDVHTHGVMHHLYESGAEGLRGAAKVLGQFGVTTIVPTIVPRMEPGWLDRLAGIAEAVPEVRGVHVPGLHIEGPFVAIGGAACATVPGDLGLLEEILAAGRGHIAIMSVSPDTPNVIPVIRRLREKGVAVFFTHTRADVAQAEAAFEAGARHATHFYDVFYPPAEKDPGVRPVGVVEAALADPRVTVDFIADGVHVHPTAIRAAVAAKGYKGVTLISDSNVGAGLPPGVYDTPWGFQVRVREGDGARHVEKNTLAGSALTMNRGIANLLQWLDLPPEQVWAMGTSNPARLLGLERKGRMAAGADADLVLWDEDFTPAHTWVGGESTYEKKGSPV